MRKNLVDLWSLALCEQILIVQLKALTLREDASLDRWLHQCATAIWANYLLIVEDTSGTRQKQYACCHIAIVTGSTWPLN